MLLAALALATAPQSLDHLMHIENARSRRASSTSPDPNSNADNLRVLPGQTRTLCELEGPGVIRHIWLTFPEAQPSWLAKDGGARPDEIVLRIHWEGAESPAVEAPVGDFFAVGFGERHPVVSTVVVVEDGDSYNCFWPMPFCERARITLTNESDRPLNSTYFHVDWEQRAVPKDAPHFCAQYHQSFPAPAGEDYLVLDATGTGHYVGTVLSVRTRSPEWFGEGDDRFYIDGETTASIQGTGTEDYFLSAWGLQQNLMPYSGTTLLDGGWGHLGQRTTAYRWHVLDPIHFATSLRVCFEHKGWVPGDERPDGKVHGHTERFDDFASVAFWYQQGQPKRFATLPAAKDRVPPDLDVTIEGQTLLEHAQLGTSKAELQRGPDWTGHGQVFVPSTASDAVFEFPFAVPTAATGRRELIVRLTESYDYGTVAVELDGKPMRDHVDLWSKDLGRAELMLGTDEWHGEHRITFRCTGRNAQSTGCYFGLDSLRFRERLAPRGEAK